MCVVALTNLFKPQPFCLHWWWWRSCRGGRRAPLKASPPFLLSSRLQPTAPQPSWHLPPDRLNELKKIQWDTWCSSQGAPLLLCCSVQLCPQTQAQRRARLGQSKRLKIHNMLLFTKMSFHLPPILKPPAPSPLPAFISLLTFCNSLWLLLFLFSKCLNILFFFYVCCMIMSCLLYKHAA